MARSTSKSTVSVNQACELFHTQQRICPVTDGLLLGDRAQGLAIVEYASLSSDASAAHVDRFYARELRIPFAFAVTPCLRCQGWKVRHQGAKQRINHNLDRANTADGVPDSETIRGSVFSLDDAETFLLALEVSNISLERAFEAILTCSDSVGARVEERIEPGSAVTIALPIAKIRLSEEQKSRPLPALSDRQFVVGKNALPAVELERFWLREELLRTVKLAWREVGSERTGACNLRHLNLDDAMLSDMQLKDFPLRSEVRQNGELCSRDDEHRWHVEECNFTEISLFLHNLKSMHNLVIPNLFPG